MGAPEIGKHPHICKMSHLKEAFWNKASQRLHSTHPKHSWSCKRALQEQETQQQARTRSTWGPSCGPEQRDPAGALLVPLGILHQPPLVFHPRLSSTSKLLLILQVTMLLAVIQIALFWREWILNYAAGASLITTFEHRAYAAILQETTLKRSTMLCHWAPKWQKSHSPKYQTHHL